jgi:hypothetical protein
MSVFDLAGLDGRVFEENRRNPFLNAPIRCSNPVASSDGCESFFLAKNCGAIRAIEFVLMLLMNKEFGH